MQGEECVENGGEGGGKKGKERQRKEDRKGTEGDIEEEKVAAASTNASNGPVTSAEELTDVGRWHIISVPQAR